MEWLVVGLFVIVIVQLSYLKKAIELQSKVIAEIAYNPIRHSIDVRSDFAKELNEIDNSLSYIGNEVVTIRRHFISDEAEREDWVYRITKRDD